MGNSLSAQLPKELNPQPETAELEEMVSLATAQHHVQEFNDGLQSQMQQHRESTHA